MKTIALLIFAAVAVTLTAGYKRNTCRQDKTSVIRNSRGQTVGTKTVHTNAIGNKTTTYRDAQGRTTYTETTKPPTRYPGRKR